MEAGESDWDVGDAIRSLDDTVFARVLCKLGVDPFQRVLRHTHKQI